MSASTPEPSRSPAALVSPLGGLTALARQLARGGSIDPVLAEAARLAVTVAGADAAVVLECRPGPRAFAVRAAHGWTTALPSEAFTGLDSAAARVLEDNRGTPLVTLPRAEDEPEAVTRLGARSACAAPIGDAERVFGVLAAYSRHPRHFDDDAAGRLDAIAAILAVAVHRVRLDAALDRERDERFRLASLVEGSDDAIVTATLDGTIISWNPGAERLYGFSEHEIVGQDVSVLVPSEHEADRHLMLARVRSGERIPAFDAEHRRKDGSLVTVSLSLSPVRDRHGQVVAFAGIAHDVTATRRFESELRQSAKMEAVGRLAGGLAHDFNNMLTVIDGYSELLLMKLPADWPDRGLIVEIHKAGERAAELAQQLMVFSRKSMVEPRVLHLSEIVQADVEMLRRVIGEDIRIDTRLAPDVEHVMADRTQFAQVLVNLVINARDAMPGGGSITIETANEEVSATHPAALRGVAPGQYVTLTVSDTGAGMDRTTLQRIFEPFFTTKGSGRGTGLGLAMLQTFVMQSGGAVTVDSEPGAGSTFRIYLPTVALPVAASPGASDGHAPRGTETILVVEDDAAVRVYTEAVLDAAGYEVLSAANGSEALEVAGDADRPIDMLMTDVVMPVLGGHALAEQFTRLHPGARVLFTSGYTPEAVSRRGIAIAPSHFLQKPYSPAALCRKVREVITTG